ncbi:integrase catalytic domain-containing protein [Nephila pilipes]|uniref:Integrase catalytic domain-containing protein n=1 Tax=Nephila pilipes TaxID=299642 RepID=A0A8X6UAR6_NEPPI|nr:integrase catalytic domain-containing protein [Nephila pilipes]
MISKEHTLENRVDDILYSYHSNKIYKKNINLGNSRTIASKRLDQHWKRLNRDPKLKVLYTQFIEENLALGHMEEVFNIDEITSDDGFFLPHHDVFRSRSRAHPLRVVFHGSQNTDLNISLNDVFSKGDAILDLFSIMLCARK